METSPCPSFPISGPVLIRTLCPQDASPGLRPLPQPGLPIRQTNLRGHSHSVSLGAVNANNRVTRRKSMTSTVAANAAAAIAATLKGHGESTATAAAMPVASHRRTFSGRKGLEPSSGGTAFGFGSYLSRSVNGTGPDPTASRKHSPTSIDENTVVDGSAPVGKPVSTKDRNRRASEGSYLVRGEGKRVSSELRCDQCGKGYKHSSCLTKHMCVSIPSRPYLPTTVTRAGNGQGLDFRASDVQAPLAQREGESCLFRLDRPASLPETSCA